MVTRKLATFAAELDYKDLPTPVAAMGKRLLLDGLGCLLAGTAGWQGASAARMVLELGGNPQATMFAGNARTSVTNAAFANGITLYSVGLNDFLQKASAHPGASVIPTILAVGEWRNCQGADLLAAMAAGYEVIDRVARSIMPSHRERGFHPTGTCGTFGATAAAGRLLGFDAEQIACAFGIAGSQAAGLYEYINDGTSTIMFHAGRAAKNGIEAALLTKAGLTGPATVLEGDRGFFRATADSTDSATALAGLGERYAFLETTFRPYFGCTSTIAASGATARIVKRRGGFRFEEIEGVKVICNPVVVRDNAETNPQTLLAARLSMAYNVALVMARGDVLVRDLEESDLRDEKMRRFMPLVSMTGDNEMPRFGCTVEVTYKSGEVDTEPMPYWRGDSSHSLSWDEVVRKFESLVGDLVSAEHKEKLAHIVENIERFDGRTLAEALSKGLKSTLS